MKINMLNEIVKRISKKQKLELNLKAAFISIRSLYAYILLKNRLDEWLEGERPLWRMAAREEEALGSGLNEKQNIEVVQSICELLEELAPEKPKGVTHYRDLIRFVQDRPGHDRSYAIDASKIRGKLGWVPRETFKTALRKIVEWYLNNQAWCERVHDGSYLREHLGVEA